MELQEVGLLCFLSSKVEGVQQGEKRSVLNMLCTEGKPKARLNTTKNTIDCLAKTACRECFFDAIFNMSKAKYFSIRV